MLDGQPSDLSAAVVLSSNAYKNYLGSFLKNTDVCHFYLPRRFWFNWAGWSSVIRSFKAPQMILKYSQVEKHSTEHECVSLLSQRRVCWHWHGCHPGFLILVPSKVVTSGLCVKISKVTLPQTIVWISTWPQKCIEVSLLCVQGCPSWGHGGAMEMSLPSKPLTGYAPLSWWVNTLVVQIKHSASTE